MNINKKNLQSLQFIASASFDTLAQLGTVGGDSKHYIYIDRGSDILAVAHLDSVCQYAGVKLDKNNIYCATLDNRLGAWIVLYLLPSLGIKTDVLLTTDEEIGQSTASLFRTAKNYKWMFSFDRAGDDVVLYQYENDANVKMLEDVGFDVGVGSYSDIAYLDHLGCTGFNFGCGMHSYHSPDAYASRRQLSRMLSLFVKFHALYKDTAIPYVPQESRYDDLQDMYQPTFGRISIDRDLWPVRCEFCDSSASTKPVDIDHSGHPYRLCWECEQDYAYYKMMQSR